MGIFRPWLGVQKIFTYNWQGLIHIISQSFFIMALNATLNETSATAVGHI